MRTDLVVDACSLFARSYFAVTKANPDEPRMCITAAFRTLANIMNPESSGYVVNRTLFAWDDGQNPEKQRTPKSDEYHEMRALLEEILLLAFDTANVRVKDREGDDVAASVAANSAKTGRCLLVSGDKDLQQLRDKNVDYWCLNTKAVLETGYINRKWKVRHPSQIAIALAIIGDATDNIQGIRGWGPKKCEQLFKAVTPEMTFREALNAVTRQIPEDKLEPFWDSLDRTLLDTQIVVPEPRPVSLCEPEELEAFDCPQLVPAYRHLFNVLLDA